MNQDSIYRRLLDVSIQLNQLMADIKESNDLYPSARCMTTLQLLQERHRAAMAQHYHDFEERHRDIHDYDEVNGVSQHDGSSGHV